MARSQEETANLAKAFSQASEFLARAGKLAHKYQDAKPDELLEKALHREQYGPHEKPLIYGALASAAAVVAASDTETAVAQGVVEAFGKDVGSFDRLVEESGVLQQYRAQFYTGDTQHTT